MMKIYIGCSLTHAPRSNFTTYTELIHSLASALQKDGHSVRYALVDSDPQLATKPAEARAKLCYNWDRSMVEECDLMIAEASYASIGLGIELQIAEQAGTPILIIFDETRNNRAQPVSYSNPEGGQHDLQIGEGYVSLMALGIPTVTGVLGYHDREALISQMIIEARLLSRTARP